MYYLGAAVYVFGTVIYVAFGSGEIQPWAIPKETEERQVLDDISRNKEKDRQKNGEPDEVEMELVSVV